MAHTSHNGANTVFCIFRIRSNFITYIDYYVPLLRRVCLARRFLCRMQKEKFIIKLLRLQGRSLNVRIT